MPTYIIEGRYGYGAWTWVVLKHAANAKIETIGAYTDVAQAQSVAIQHVEAERRGEG